MIKLSLSTACPQDVESIARFQEKMAWATENMRLCPATVLKGVAAVVENPHLGFYLLARDETGRLAGSLMIQKEWSDWRAAWVWWIHSVWIEEWARRKGVYTCLFEEVCSRAKTEGVKGVRLYVEQSNLGAQKTYESHGMTREHYFLYEKMM